MYLLPGMSLADTAFPAQKSVMKTHAQPCAVGDSGIDAGCEGIILQYAVDTR